MPRGSWSNRPNSRSIWSSPRYDSSTPRPGNRSHPRKATCRVRTCDPRAGRYASHPGVLITVDYGLLLKSLLKGAVIGPWRSVAMTYPDGDPAKTCTPRPENTRTLTTRQPKSAAAQPTQVSHDLAESTQRQTPKALSGKLAGLSLSQQVVTLAIWPLIEQFLAFLVGTVDLALAGHLDPPPPQTRGDRTHWAWRLTWAGLVP